MPKEKQKAWVQRSLRLKSNLHIFGRYFFPTVIATDVPDAHLELLEELNSKHDSGIIFPRGFAKSTWVKIDTLHDIVYGLEPVILYISDTLESAGFHFESMKTELENNDDLRAVYGNLVPKATWMNSVKWTNKHFETNSGVNVVARGANKGRGVNIKNKRPTKIIVDDAETDEQVASAMRRRKYHDWLYNVITPSKDKNNGRIKIIGTVIHPECEVLKFYNGKGGIYRRAIEGYTKGQDMFESGYSIWPQYWSLEDLRKIKDGYTKPNGEFVEGVGTRTFMQEWQQEPTNDELARLNPDFIDENVFTILPKQESKLRKVITMDPQSGESSKADEYAITVLAWYTGDRHRYVLEQHAGRASQMQQATKLVQVWQDHQDAHIVGIEKVLSQVAVYQHVLDWKNGGTELKGVDNNSRNIPLKAISPEGKDKVARFEIHEPMIERGELHIRPEMKQLREQILFIGTISGLEHDDRVDSMIMGLEQSFKGGEKNKDILKEMTQKDKTVAGNLHKAKF